MSDDPQHVVKKEKKVDPENWFSWILDIVVEGFLQLIWGMIRWIGVAIFHFFRFLIELFHHA